MTELETPAWVTAHEDWLSCLSEVEEQWLREGLSPAPVDVVQIHTHEDWVSSAAERCDSDGQFYALAWDIVCEVWRNKGLEEEGIFPAELMVAVVRDWDPKRFDAAFAAAIEASRLTAEILPFQARRTDA